MSSADKSVITSITPKGLYPSCENHFLNFVFIFSSFLVADAKKLHEKLCESMSQDLYDLYML